MQVRGTQVGDVFATVTVIDAKEGGSVASCKFVFQDMRIL